MNRTAIALAATLATISFAQAQTYKDSGGTTIVPGFVPLVGCSGVANCAGPVSGSNPMPVSGSFSATLSGFTPSLAGARMTPFTVTVADSSGTLPTGTVTVVDNVGANPMYCNVNGVAATTSDQLIAASSWFAFTIPAAITTLHCIATGGSTTANGVGGAGLATGAGGGGGSGVGGAITAASGAYAAGSLAVGSGVDGWNLTEGAKGDAAWVSGSGSMVAILKTISGSATASATAANQTTVQGTVAAGTAATKSQLGGCVFNTSLPTLTTGQGVASQCDSSGRAIVTVSNTNANGSATSANSSPVVIASDQAAVKVSPQAITTGGSSTTGNIAANNTTAVVIKASAGTLYGVQVYGIGSAPAYLKIYNATSATCGSGTPVKRLMIPAASTAANGAGSNITFGPAGVAFGTGITYCVTTGITDADTTAPAASTFLVNVDYQ